MERITVFVPVFKTKEMDLNWMTLRCIETLRRHTRYPAWELVIYDDGSDEDCHRALVETGVKVIGNDRNMGPNYTINQFPEVADTELIAMVADDALMIPGWLEKLEYYLRLFGYRGLMSANWVRVDRDEWINPDWDRYIAASKANYGRLRQCYSGVAWLTTRETLREIKYESGTKYYGGDRMFFYKCLERDIPVFQVESCIALHLNGATMKKIDSDIVRRDLAESWRIFCERFGLPPGTRCTGMDRGWQFVGDERRRVIPEGVVKE